MYTMKEVCQIVGWSYETLKYYCKEGLTVFKEMWYEFKGYAHVS